MTKARSRCALLFSFFISFSLFSANDQCLVPGELLKKIRVGSETDTASANFRRESTFFDRGFSSSSPISVNTYDVIENHLCKKTSYTWSKEMCRMVDNRTAKGQGNEIFQSFFNKNIKRSVRAESFSQNVEFEYSNTSRLMIARHIIGHIDSHVHESAKPVDWEMFVTLIEEAVYTSRYTQGLTHSITVNYKVQNQRNLGLKLYEKLEYEQGNGNRLFKDMFNLNLSKASRAAKIERIKGIDSDLAWVLSEKFIAYASLNGIPKSWDDAVELFTALTDENFLDSNLFIEIVVNNEYENQNLLGLGLKAKVCDTITETRYYNKIEVERERVFKERLDKDIRFNIINGPLLRSEAEEFTIRYNGMEQATVSVNSRYNKYKISRNKDNDNQIVLTLKGERRLKVIPKNTLEVQAVRNSDKTTSLIVSDYDYNLPHQAKSYVKVIYYESISFWPDKKLHEQTYELSSSSLTTKISSDVKARKKDRKVYVKYQVIRKNSPYYQDKPSSKKESNEA